MPDFIIGPLDSFPAAVMSRFIPMINRIGEMVQSVIIPFSRTEKNILPLMLRTEMVQNWRISEESVSFGTKQPSALLQDDGMVPLAYTLCISFYSTIALLSLHSFPRRPLLRSLMPTFSSALALLNCLLRVLTSLLSCKISISLLFGCQYQ